jgi:16S rRNA (cytosine967-C5)-methyltransferase
MEKGIKTRLLAHQILFNIKKNNTSFDEALKLDIERSKLSISDKKMAHNIVLSSMRYSVYIKKILTKYIKKNTSDHQFILFVSAITQIVYLNFKEYAVVNSTVELAKNKNIKVNPGFVNAVLKKVCKDKVSLKDTKIKFIDFPKWFTNQVNYISQEDKNFFISSIVEKPNLHLVFKENISKIFETLNTIKTSEKSMVLLENSEIKNIPEYENGNWWVQDYSAMLPLYLTKKIHNKKIIDMCAAPGGKLFQSLSENANVDIVEISKKRAKLLRLNLDRLKYNNKIMLRDALEIPDDEKYDFVLIDAPCSSVGTIRRHPEIFFRTQEPDLQLLLKKQNNLINKGKKILKKGGTMIYMVCSFLPIETNLKIDDFLKNNSNFSINKFNPDSKNKELVNKNGYIQIIPKKFNNFNIDGFFAAKLTKND